MDIERMLTKCVEAQWTIDDLDWNAQPRAMSRDEEMAVVQCFTDMAEIERFAGALFEEQRRIVTQPTLKKIFATFVADEHRHAVVAERLARHYDVHHYARYRPSAALLAFKPHFLNSVRFLSAEIANTYITSGELMLDVALLRSLDDYVGDDMSARAMALINRDESRHIAIDYYMTEFYASPAYQAWQRSQPRPNVAFRMQALASFVGVLWHAGPFARDVLFGPMRRIDPSGKRLREAVKRLQLLGNRPDVAKRPFNHFQQTLRAVVCHPVLGPLLGGIAKRLTAQFPDELYQELFTRAELEHAQSVSIDELAQEALAAKYLA
jgi:hypothetical protein